MEFAIFDCMPLDSRLRGNDEKYQGMEFNDLNCYRKTWDNNMTSSMDDVIRDMAIKI